MKRILIVDDDPDLVDRITQLLCDDYEVLSTMDWGELNSIYFRGPGVDLILMDVNLPVLRGDQLAKILTKSDKPTRILLHSSEDEATLRRLVIETGVDGYLSKSLRAGEFLGQIEELLAD